VEATFDSVRCRLVVLRDELPGMSALARAEGRADRDLARAEALAAAAEARCAAARRGPARVKLRKVGRHVGAALRMVRGHYAAATVPALVESFTAGATDLLADTRALSRALSCP